MYFKSFAECLGILLVSMVLLLPGTVLAQDNPQWETEPTKPEEVPARIPETEAEKKFDKVFTEWKEMLSGMREVRTAAQNAEDAELPALQKKYDEYLALGESIIPRLRDTAIAVYAESPNEDNQISRWLSTIGNDLVAKDQFEAAKPALDALVEGKTTDPSVYNSAAVVAFIQNDYELAKSLFEEAASKGGLTSFSQRLAMELENYQRYWEREKSLREAAENAEGEDRLPQVKIVVENRGEITLELYENEAPETVANFIHLIEKGFYDGRTFHRVIGNFMVQGGCPKGDGTGGPGYEIFCECVNENHRKHFAGSLSMAHAGRDTGGSQFFLTLVTTPDLDGKHTVFGRIIEGFDVLAKIQRRDPDKPEDLAKMPDKIEKIEVLFKRNHVYQPNKK